MTSGDHDAPHPTGPTDRHLPRDGSTGDGAIGNLASAQDTVLSATGGGDDEADWVGKPVRWTLGDEHPELAHLAWMSIDAPELRPFLLHQPSGHLVIELLHHNGCYLIGDILDVTDQEILDWRSIGRGKQAAILAFFSHVAANALSLLEAHISDLSAPQTTEGPALPPEPPAPAMPPALARVAAWARVTSGARNWGDVRDALSTAPVPDDIARAVADLECQDLPDETPTRSAEEITSAWVSGLDDRDTAILRGRLLEAPACKLDEIGKRFGVSRERVRQLEVKLKTRLDELPHEDPCSPVRWRIFDIRERLGSFAPSEHADALIGARGDDLTPDLLLRLAGYDRDAESVRRDRYSPPAVSQLPRLEADLPLLDETQIRADLITDGVRPELVDWAIGTIEGIARREGQLVVWPRSVVEKSYALLSVRGTPMTPEELASGLGQEVSIRSLRQRLFEDPRMCRATRSTIGLRAWGAEEYTTLVDLMCTALEGNGPTPLAALVDDLVRRFNVNPTSVLSYSAAPIFVVDNGLIRLRGADQPYQPRLAPEQVPGLYRDGDDHLLWNVAADHDLMRGSGRSIPAEIATFLGVTPGTRLLLSNPVRDVPISWLETSHMGPNLGSLKALAESAGAQLGDHLHIRFDRPEKAVSVEVSSERPAAITIAAQVAWLTGLPGHRCADRNALAEAVQTQPADMGDVLRARGDALISNLASQLP